MPAQSSIDILWDIEQFQDTLLQGRQVSDRRYPLLKHHQRQPGKDPQHHLRGRACGGPRGITRIEPGQSLSVLWQPLAHRELDQGQHAQADTQQPDQAFDAGLRAQIHRRERQRSALEPAEATLNEIGVAVGQHLGQRQVSLIGGINPPPEPLDGRGQGGVIDRGLYRDRLAVLEACQPLSIAAFGAGFDLIKE